MKDDKRFELYERLYFHEVDAREKISARLQIPLALLLSITSVYAFLVKGIAFDNSSLWNMLFGVVFSISIILFATSASHFIKSFYGHTYEFIPSALATENYRKELIETYKDYNECDSLVEKYFNEYLFKYYNECSSANTVVNDKRSTHLHKCNTYMILTALPLSLAFLIFTLANIDKNSVEKEYKIRITNPVHFQNGNEPIKINGNINTTTLEVNLSEDFEELINERREKAIGTAATASSSTTKENR